MNKTQALLAGTDLELTYSAMTGEYDGTNTATVVSAMREAMHRVLYTVANSNAMNGMVPGSKITYGVAPWQYGVWGGSAALVALAAFFGYKAVKNHKLMGAEGEDGAADVPEVKKGDKKASDEK